ncbi:sensor domain-containing diguanylate cyclase [Microvirga terricola]|uniref:diguanylate cyclase n=1 Tax=Microvirga terricola TaxID=2719797 RepID=A0ABX0VA77_9HYPH|nr:sensor domain-containing diguanylate cyclase [Microvirga terricola]NIX76443.1 diguanylate cyclase [Microvirga terricola]
MAIMRNLSLRRQITILVGLLCIALVSAAAIGASYVVQQRTREIVMHDAAETAASMAALLDRNMYERFREVQNLAEMTPLREVWTGDSATTRRLLEQFQNSLPDYAWLGFATPDGTVRAATRGMLEGQSVQERPWFREGLKAPMVGDVHEAKLLASLVPSSANGEPLRLIDIAMPVHDSKGELIGVLGAHLSWNWAREQRRVLFALPEKKRGKSVWILSSDGTVTLGRAALGEKPFSPEEIENMRREQNGAFEDVTENEAVLTGFALTSGYRDYPGLGWIVISRQPDKIAFAAAHGIVMTILTIDGIVACFGLIFALIIARGVADPLRRIIEAADSIGRDPNVTSLPRTGGSAEIVRLSAVLRSLLRRAGTAEQRIAEASSQHEKDITALVKLAETDALSGLLNRRGFDSIGNEAFKDYRSRDESFAILMIDLDFFKSVNDTFGHGAGDDVIRTVGHAMKRALRSTDRLARFGGEEFIVLVREAGRDEVPVIAQKLRRAIESTSTLHQDKWLSVTASVGGAIVRESDRDVQDVIERADTALYQAKAAGRNRAVIDELQLQLATSAA